MRKFSLKMQILSLSTFMSLVAGLVGFAAHHFMKEIIYDYSMITEQNVPGIRAANRMLLSFRLARIELLHLIIPGKQIDFYEASIKTINHSWVDFDSDMEKYLAAGELSSEKKTIMDDFKSKTNQGREIFKKTQALYSKGAPENSPEYQEMVRLVSVELGREIGPLIKEATKKLIDYEALKVEKNSALATATSEFGLKAILVTTIIGTLLGFFFALFLSNYLVKKIGTIVESISNSTNTVNSTSIDIAASAQALSEAVTEQASSLQETAAALEQITAMITRASESVDSTDANARSSQQKATEGQQAVEEMLSSINQISESNLEIMAQVNSSNDQMGEIIKVIQDIGSKTKVINEIVFQTKLLSFNASVEAARAGENGKGFSVVAEEIGSLAKMSGQAAKEITDLLENSSNKVVQIVDEAKNNVSKLVASSKQKVDYGVKTAHHCSDILSQIVVKAAEVTQNAQEISSASKEQAQGVSEINKAMSQLDIVTQQNSSASNKSAASAVSLSQEASSLNESVNKLIETIRGGKGEDKSSLSESKAA